MKDSKAPRPKKECSTTPIEKYNSKTDRKSSQNGPFVFSAFVFTAAFCITFALGYLVAGELSLTILALAVIVSALAIMTIRVAMQWEKVVIVRFGKFSRTKGPGLFLTIPFFDHIALRADQRVMVTGFSAEEALTTDLVPVNVDAVLFWMIWDAEKACFEVENYYNSVSLAAQTALRDAIGRTRASEVASRRNQLDSELQEAIELKTAEWGITIFSVEIRDITIPKELQEAMSVEAQAERERNARMMLAEVEKEISEMLVEVGGIYAGDVLEKHEIALKLRTMHLLYESVKGSGGTVVIPSAYSEGFNDPLLDRVNSSVPKA